MFRKYTREGALVFERLLQSRQLDPHVLTMPTEWPMRTVDGLTFPFVTPLVRTAAVDPRGNLWIATSTSHVYVFDSEGEKLATYQLIGAGPLMPDALWFAPDGRLLVPPACTNRGVRSLRRRPWVPGRAGSDDLTRRVSSARRSRHSSPNHTSRNSSVIVSRSVSV